MNSKPLNILTTDINQYLEIDNSRSLGQGAYGSVFKAINRETGGLSAAKIIKQSGKKIMAQKYLMREVSYWQKLSHPRISPLKQIYYWKNDNEVSIVLESEFCEMNLAQFLKKTQTFPESQFKFIIKQILEALTYLHSHQLIHRDIKETNILIKSNYEVKLCDFGFIRQMDLEISEYTNNVGTPSYRAPEQAIGRKEYSCQVDIWALGVVMVNLLLNTQIFTAQNDFELILKLLEFFEREKFLDLRLTATESNSIPISQVKIHYLEIILKEKISWQGLDLILKMLEIDPLQRIEAKTALEHEWFKI